MRRTLGLLALLGSLGTALGQRQYIVVVDASASRAASLTSEAQSFVGDLAKTLTPGDELVLLEMLDQGVAGAPVKLKFDYPLAKGNGTKARQDAAFDAYRRGVAIAIPRFFATASAKKLQHTDILSTMPIVAELTHDSRGKSSTVVFLSDMLQSAKGIEMDRGLRLPAADYVARAKAEGTLASLPGSCILVVGADTTTKLGVKVRRFWDGYFKAAGARFSPANYRLTPPPATADFCD